MSLSENERDRLHEAGNAIQKGLEEIRGAPFDQDPKQIRPIEELPDEKSGSPLE